MVSKTSLFPSASNGLIKLSLKEELCSLIHKIEFCVSLSILHHKSRIYGLIFCELLKQQKESVNGIIYNNF